MINPETRPNIVTLDNALLEKLRVRIGLSNSDTSSDNQITEAWTMTLFWLESYLDRYLVAGNYVEVRTHKAGKAIGLKGYPIQQVNSVDDIATNKAIDAEGYHVDFASGVTLFDAMHHQHQITIDYDIVDPVVGALLLAAYSVFDQVYAGLNISGASAAGTGAIKSISSDGAKVDFDVSNSGGSSGGIDIESGLPTNVIGLLVTCKRYTC